MDKYEEHIENKTQELGGDTGSHLSADPVSPWGSRNSDARLALAGVDAAKVHDAVRPCPLLQPVFVGAEPLPEAHVRESQVLRINRLVVPDGEAESVVSDVRAGRGEVVVARSQQVVPADAPDVGGLRALDEAHRHLVGGDVRAEPDPEPRVPDAVDEDDRLHRVDGVEAPDAVTACDGCGYGGCRHGFVRSLDVVSPVRRTRILYNKDCAK